MMDRTTKLLLALNAAGLASLLFRGALALVPAYTASGGSQIANDLAGARHQATVALALWSSVPQPTQTNNFSLSTSLSHYLDMDALYQPALEARVARLEARLARLERSRPPANSGRAPHQ